MGCSQRLYVKYCPPLDSKYILPGELPVPCSVTGVWRRLTETDSVLPSPHAPCPRPLSLLSRHDTGPPVASVEYGVWSVETERK